MIVAGPKASSARLRFRGRRGEPPGPAPNICRPVRMFLQIHAALEGRPEGEPQQRRMRWLRVLRVDIGLQP